MADNSYPVAADERGELSQEESQSVSLLLSDGDNEETSAQRIARFFRRQGNRFRKLALCGEGFTLKGARLWIRRCRADWASRDYSRRDIKWAHKHGFSATQVERYGVAGDNIDSFISERAYDFLQPINGKYDKWFKDRITTRVIAGKRFQELFEIIHFNVISRNGQLLYTPLSPEAKVCMEQADSPSKGFMAFLQQHEDLGLSLAGSSWLTKTKLPVEVVHREDGKVRYRIGGVRLTPRALRSYLRERANTSPLVLFERAQEDESFAYAGEDMIGEVRVLMFNPTGTEPVLGDATAVLRERTKRSEEREDADERMGEADSDEEVLEDSGEPVFHHYAMPVSIEDGSYSGGRAMFTRDKFQDTMTLLGSDVELKGTIPHWADIKESLLAFCKHIPQIELVQFAIRTSGDGFRIVGVNPSPVYNRAYPLPADLQAFLNGKVKDKRENKGSSVGLVRHAAFLRSRRAFTKFFYPAGMVYYQGLRYPHDVIQDFFSRNGVPLGRKLWAYKHGFLSYRLDLYPELCEENWQEYVTDLEYRWLRHINPKYRTWMEDKLTFKYLLAQHGECLPGYYFFTSCRAGENRIIPLMDCPEGYGATVDDILRLARELGVLALKPDEGSHGEGFYKLTYTEEEGYALNGEVVPAERAEEVLRNPSNQYLVSEYIDLHPDLKRLYAGSVNTVRVTMFKEDGVHPQIGNAYLRIGSERSGAVDNVVAGGFVAEVDINTGKFGDARTLLKNRLVREDVHPDSGAAMEGVLPNWGYVREKVLAMARDIPQLEYLGFDVAITESGFKLLEINRMPDYPRISRLTPETIHYLLGRIAAKKRFMRIDKDKSLVKLPRRNA